VPKHPTITTYTRYIKISKSQSATAPFYLKLQLARKICRSGERFTVTDPADEESDTAAHNQIFELPINLGEVSTPTCQAITSITMGFIGFRRRSCNREPTAETETDRQTDSSNIQFRLR